MQPPAPSARLPTSRRSRGRAVGTAGRRAPLAAGLILAACTAPAPPPAPPPAPVVATTDPGLSTRGTSTLSIRTQAPGLFGPAEVEGIACTLEARGFRATFTSPATIGVPNLGTRQPEAALTCTQGALTRSLMLPPVNLTRVEELNRRLDRQSRNNDFLGIGLIATAMVGGLRRDQTGDVWGYADTTLILGP
jgi:hypothetical protein